MNLFNKATDPLYYDSPEISWTETDGGQSPTKLLAEEYLEKYLDIKNKTIIDIGSGTGTFFDFFKEKGATLIEGIEPSRKNFEVAKNKYPEITVFNGSLENYFSDKKFDRAISVMVFEHISDIKSSFEKIAGFLNDDGVFYLIVANMEYFLTPRFDYKLDIQDLPNNEHVVASGRSYGTLFDIVRPIENYETTAKGAGFKLKNTIPIFPTEKFMNFSPKYKEFEHTPIFKLLIFKK